MAGLRRPNLRAALALAALVFVVSGGDATALPQTGSARESTVRQVAASAYVYGVALLDEQRVISAFPANLLINVTHLSTPAERLVPLPNVDTLYTTARLDLGGGPMIVHVPEEHGRYYTFQFLDAYTNSFAYIGRRVSGTHPGDYAIVGPGWHGQLPSGVRRIVSPTPTVWLLGRTLVDGPSDLTPVNLIQHSYTLAPLSAYGHTPPASIFLQKSTLNPKPLPTGLAFYDALGAAMQADPPPAADRALLRRLAHIGIGPGRTPSTEHLDAATRSGLLQGIKDGRGQVARYAATISARSARTHHGWLIPPRATGRFGTHYLLRAYIAQTALGANVPAEAEYPLTRVDSRLKPLTGRHRYVLHFAAGKLPPVRAFWSLTVYGRDLFLVTNPIDRYAVGDRTPGLHRNRDGSLDIVLSHTAPLGRARANWLPVPPGRFLLCLRLYEPERGVLTGAWPLPTITPAG